MAPPTSLDKAIADRKTVQSTLCVVESALGKHKSKSLSQAEVTSLIEIIKTCQSDLIDNQCKLQLAAPADLSDHTTKYQKLLLQIIKIHGEVLTIQNAFPSTSSTSTSASHSHSSCSSSSTGIKLPPLELPTFNGNLHEWVSFKDIFSSAVHNNLKISKYQKLTYLKAQLKDEAARQIQSLAITDSNYDIAWDQLTSRYQNDRELFFAVMSKLFDQPVVVPDSSTSIRQLIDNTQECIRSLQVLKIATDPMDSTILYLLTRKMDSTSKQLWEQTLKDSAIPAVKLLFEFLEQRARALAAAVETIEPSKPQRRITRSQSNIQQTRSLSHHVSNTNSKCKLCHNYAHALYKCKKFLDLSVQDRSEAIKKTNSCYNCLHEGHQASQCPNQKSCKTCNRHHHTLLHKQQDSQSSYKTQESNQLVHFTASTQSSPVTYDTILGTVLIQVADRHGQFHTCRALADNGCNTHYITESFARKLSLPKKRCFTSATGLNEATVANSSSFTHFMVSPHFDQNISFPISRCLITSKITSKLPQTPFNHQKWSHLHGLQLADPEYHVPQHVDLLLGAEYYYAIQQGGIITGPPNSPVAIKTSFGWLVGGGSTETPLFEPQVYTTISSTSKECDQDILHSIDINLRHLWEMEAEPVERHSTSDEKAAESHFVSTYRREPDGRFIVKIPFKPNAPVIGSSLLIAIKRLQYLERRLDRQPQFKEEYKKFMREYNLMGHMREVPPVPSDDNSACYIPHHYVIKASSTTTKFRVVFDASAKTSNGISLNDTMYVGPTIQDSLYDILIRFRVHKIAFTADIEKMYRQVKIDQVSNPQRIVWREKPSDPIKHYQLQTVTYGTGSGPFLAIRALHELANLEKDSFPRASQVAIRDMYVDDLMSGEPTVAEALATQSELLQLIKKGAMDLRKWSSNCQEVLDSLPPDMRETKSLPLFEDDLTVKTLGIIWNPRSDQFTFQVSFPCSEIPITKRIVLSQLASLFDPIGWLSPILITGKIFMQSIWKSSKSWDDELSPIMQQEWKSFQVDIQGLSNIRINRYFLAGTSLTCPSLNSRVVNNQVKFYLAGFSDASTKAYAAVIYLCAYDELNHSSISLVTAKTRVAPVKEVSIPRLELCGALVLAIQLAVVRKAIKIPIQSMKAWTDSTVTLAWIQSQSEKWKTFVSNRVTKIQELLPPENWLHVPGVENPADCASRGIDLNSFVNHSLWWQGPAFLKSWPCEDTNHAKCAEEDLQIIMSEKKSEVTSFHISITSGNTSLLYKYSSLLKLSRVTAFIIRFCRNLSKKQKKTKKSSIQDIVQSHPLSPDEIREGTNYWVRDVQSKCFSEELKYIAKQLQVHRESKLRHLSPFIDSKGILRVGGRLSNSELTHDQKHPILIPYKSYLTQLVIQEAHLNHFHAGPQLLHSVVLSRYWIIRSRDAVRNFIRTCFICCRHKAKTLQAVMSDLPSFRIIQIRPFSKCGVDYAGPFLIRPLQPRSKVTLKAYVSVFICPVTRAIHLELVSSLSSDAFIAALRRFMSRRGKPTDIYSDCGTNFVGANKEMKELLKMFSSHAHNSQISDHLSIQGINWHYNPPSAPHFGGLWEAGVKSMKHHLKRIIGVQRLTFEEFTTTITQIEAILNSRPLTPESTSPDDLAALTPGHFLIGAPLTSIPEPSLLEVKTNHLSRWQLLQQFVQSFWKRWSSEYLTRLQQRPKWMIGDRKLGIGDLVLIKEDNMPPLQWRMARVLQLHPGKDGVPRVATVKTHSGQYKRPIVKLCLLPVDHPSETSSPST